jgi:hypothetical protein
LFKGKNNVRRTLISAAVGCLFATPLAFAAPADDLKSLLDQGKPQEAYALGKSMDQQLGDPDFDLYYGIASIDAGHAGEGVMALERHVFAHPENLRARLELARGFFLLNEDDRAREEFLVVKAQNVPPDVAATIDGYLDSIAARADQRTPQAHFYVQGGIGTDSNVNGGVGNSMVNLPIFGAVQLSSQATRTHSSFANLGAGGLWTQPLSAKTTLIAGLDAEINEYRPARQYEQVTVGGHVGVMHRDDAWTYRASLVESTLTLESDRYRSIAGLAGEASYALSANQALSVNGSLFRLDYAGVSSFRTSNMASLGIGYRHAFAADWQPVLALSASYSEEDNKRGRGEYSQDVYGLRAAVTVKPEAQWTVTAGLTYQDHRYRDSDPNFGLRRADTYTGVDLTAVYALSKQLSVRGELSYTDNRSNIALNAFDRTIASVKLRYDF